MLKRFIWICEDLKTFSCCREKWRAVLDNLKDCEPHHRLQVIVTHNLFLSNATVHSSVIGANRTLSSFLLRINSRRWRGRRNIPILCSSGPMSSSHQKTSFKDVINPIYCVFHFRGTEDGNQLHGGTDLPLSFLLLLGSVSQVGRRARRLLNLF